MLSYISALPWLKYASSTNMYYHNQVILSKGFKPGKTEADLYKAGAVVNRNLSQGNSWAVGSEFAMNGVASSTACLGGFLDLNCGEGDIRDMTTWCFGWDTVLPTWHGSLKNSICEILRRNCPDNNPDLLTDISAWCSSDSFCDIPAFELPPLVMPGNPNGWRVGETCGCNRSIQGSIVQCEPFNKDETIRQGIYEACANDNDPPLCRFVSLVNLDIQLLLCKARWEIDATLGNCCGYEINCNRLECSPACSSSVCWSDTDTGEQECGCVGGAPNPNCHCITNLCGGTSGCVDTPPAYCPCLGTAVYEDDECPALCCDPAIEGCVHCCPPDNPECNYYLPEEFCCSGEYCVECPYLNGAYVSADVCEAFHCSLCKNEPPGNTFCSTSCKQCEQHLWVPIDASCDESTIECGDVPTTYCCSLCTAPSTGSCPGCYYCTNQLRWLPLWRVCDPFSSQCPNPLNPSCNPLGGNSLTMCYSYSQNDPIYYNPNALSPSVSLTYTTPGSDFTYGSIATLCEIPDEFQLCVFVTRVWEEGEEAEEVQLTYLPSNPAEQDVGFSLNIETSMLHLYRPLVSGETLRIRRCSDTSKMFFHFTDGAKLSAKDLNASLHQLLFLIQEKEFATQAVHEHFPLPSIANAWDDELTYTVNSFVYYTVPHTPPELPNQTLIYTALTGIAAGQAPPSDNTDWKKVAWATNGFVLDGGQDLSGPIVFSLHGIDIGDALVWNGNKFVGQPLNLFGSQEAGFEMEFNNLQDGDSLVYEGSTFKWKNFSLLNNFDTTLTSTFTVDNLVVNNWPTFTDNILTNDAFDGDPYWESFAAELDDFKRDNKWIIPNPPTIMNMVAKVFPNNDPLTWIEQVNEAMSTSSAQNSSPVLAHLEWNLFSSTPSTHINTAFWSSPGELYDVNGLAECDTYSGEGAYESNGNTKIWGYGLHSLADPESSEAGFFFNSPESRTTTMTLAAYTAGNVINLHSDPLVLSDDDAYLRNLRDLAFALDGASVPADAVELSRVNRSTQITAQYTSDTCNWKDLFGGSSEVTGIRFKAFKEIVYVNQMAGVLGATNDNGTIQPPDWTMGGVDLDFKDNTDGGLYNTPNQIHWFLTGISSTSPSYNVQLPMNPLNAQLWPQFADNTWTYPVNADTPVYPPAFGVSGGDPDDLAVAAPFDPVGAPTAIGDLAMLVDVNRLFSTSSSYMPEPRDTYVFDIVFDQDVSLKIAPGESLVEPARGLLNLTWGLSDINSKSIYTDGLQAQLDMLKKEDLRLWLSPLKRRATKYTTKLYIEVPRLKYIGYTGFFRRTAPQPGKHTQTLALAYATMFNAEDYTESDTLQTLNTIPEIGEIDKIIGLRNEAAVKFVRMGIPTNLWLTISLIATKTKVSLLTQ